MQDSNFDVIIVGGGPAGVHSAYPLVMAGLKVAIIDGGIKSEINLEKDFTQSFEEIRRNINDQYKVFLGEKLNDLVQDEESHVLSMTSGNREYIGYKTNMLPLKTEGVQVIQTLAKGGLSEAWSSACDIFDAEELRTTGIPANEMKDSYQEVMTRIGLSGNLPGFKTMPGIKLDSHAAGIIEKYNNTATLSDDFIVKPSILAIITEPLGKRVPLSYTDMEFFLNQGDSIYRARFTLEDLEKKDNLTYIPGRVVESISPYEGLRRVKTITFDGNEESYSGKHIIMAAGALNTARILLKSFSLHNKKVPFLTKTHFIIPTLDIKSLGKKDDEYKCSLTQLFITDKKRTNGMLKSFSLVLSYKSLLLYKLARRAPLPAPEALSLFSLLTPSLVALDIRFPSVETDDGFIYLDEKSILHIHGKNHDKSEYKTELCRVKKLLRKLGLFPLQIVENPFGSTAHYAGGVPINGNGKFYLSADTSGRLDQDNNIFVADSSTWRALPAKPPALTIMANANRVGRNVLKLIN